MGLISLGILLGLALLVGAFLSFIQMLQISELKTRVRGLSEELATLKHVKPDISEATPRDDASTMQTALDNAPGVSEISESERSRPSVPPPPSVADVAAHSSSVTTTPTPTPPSKPAGRSMDFEDKLGSQLTVWIGGIALALGGIFLVKYSIDAGLLGPGMRIFLGALLAAILLGLGEYTLRTDVVGVLAARLPRQKGDAPHAYIPGVLTAAGLITAFATTYAAYVLYGFLGNAGAFTALALISFGGLAISVRHGPGIAAVGLLGGYVTPGLVSSTAPSAWNLFIYLAVLTGAVYLTAWFRKWLNLAWLACAGATLWGVLWLLATYKTGDAVPLALFIIILPVLAVVFLRTDNNDPSQGFDWAILPIFAANAALCVLFAIVQGHGTIATLTTTVVAALFVVSATRWQQWLPLAGLAALTFGGHLLTWPEINILRLPALSAFSLVDDGRFLNFAIVGAGALLLVALWHTFTRTPQLFWGGIAATVPVSAFAYSYLRVADFERSLPFAMAGLALAALFGTLTERLDRRDTMSDVAVSDRSWTVGALAAATCAFVAFALAINFERGWLTIGLAAMAPALAWITLKRPIPILRWIIALLAAAVVARLIWDPRIVGDALGTTPLFNWILYGYGLPTVAFGAAGWLMLRDGDDLPAQIVRAAAMAFGVTLIGMEIRHLMNGGNVFASRFGLAETAIHTLSWLGLSLGLRWGALRTHDGLMMQAANLVGLFGLVTIATGHLFVQHPMVTHDALAGGTLVNTLVLAYALPALLCGLLVWQIVGRREILPAAALPGLPWTPRTFAETFAFAAGALALLLSFTYLTLEVSRIFQGPVLRFNPSEGELYTWSAVWIGFALALLYAGIRYRSQLLRHAGFGVLLIATLKIFLVDMSALTGLLRALSFIGLGGALIGIGYAYQRLVLQYQSGPPDAEDN